MVPSDIQPFLSLGFGYIFLEFFYYLLEIFPLLHFHTVATVPLSVDTVMNAQLAYYMKTLWQKELISLLGQSYHGDH